MNRISFILIVALISISFTGNSQTGNIAGHVSATDPLWKTANVHLIFKKGYMVMNETKTDTAGKFYIKNLSAGFYTLSIEQIGFRRNFTMDSIRVFKDSTIELEVDYPGPCGFVSENNKEPQCPDGHKDNIIPIIYGKPSRETVQEAGKGLVHLGGCMVTDCDPHYYCTIHKKEF
jgi:hypothetical protein